jgi:hypothetical protein
MGSHSRKDHVLGTPALWQNAGRFLAYTILSQHQQMSIYGTIQGASK